MFFPLFAVNKPFNRHRVRYQERNRKRNRRKQASRQRAIQQRRFRQRLGCVGTCKNMFSCMFSGQKVDWDKHGTCPGMMDTCCTSWNDKKRQKYIKSGRSLGPFSPQVQVYLRCRKDSLFTKASKTIYHIRFLHFCLYRLPNPLPSKKEKKIDKTFPPLKKNP